MSKLVCLWREFEPGVALLVVGGGRVGLCPGDNTWGEKCRDLGMGLRKVGLMVVIGCSCSSQGACGCSSACCKSEVIEYEVAEGNVWGEKGCARCVKWLLWFVVSGTSEWSCVDVPVCTMHCFSLEEWLSA